MAEKDRKPEIRFKGFADHWEQRKLTYEVELFSGLTYSPNDVIKEGGTLVLRSSNVKNGEIINADNVYVKSDAVNVDNVQVGDIIVVVRNGSRSLIGKHGQIKVKMDNTVIGAFMTGMRSSNSSFINTLLSTPVFDKEVEKNLGATINQITNSMFQNMYFMFPNEDEQIKIGDYFSNIDNLVTLHQRKYDKLVKVKKSMLEKMFPKNGADVPEIRFKGFTAPWEKRKLGEYCEMYNGDRGINYPSEKDMVSDGIPFINAGDLKNGRVNLSNANKITREKYSQLGGAKLQLGDIVYCLRGTLGKNAFIDNFNEGTVASSLVALRPKNIDGKYLFHILNSDIEFRQRTVCDEGAAQPNLSAKSLGGFDIPIPKIEEQIRLSGYLDSLDNLITLHHRKLEKLKNIKNSCLEKMFV
ncbi:MAG: restriction endonuclease subunit S [Lachnospiraceae bacterium]|nr:restriction endonuclease subunit S [Lachnospiraceae bacterium]